MIAQEMSSSSLLFTVKPRVSENLSLTMLSDSPLCLVAHWHGMAYLCGGEGCSFCGVARKYSVAYLACSLNHHQVMLELSEASYRAMILSFDDAGKEIQAGSQFLLKRRTAKRPFEFSFHRNVDLSQKVKVERKVLLLSALRLYRVPIASSLATESELIAEASANAVAISRVRL